jgi:hypothetical protein
VLQIREREKQIGKKAKSSEISKLFAFLLVQHILQAKKICKNLHGIIHASRNQLRTKAHFKQ